MPSRIARRTFLSTGAAAAVGLGAAPSVLADPPPAAPGTFQEPARDVPIVEEADVLVCGAGPAGVAAALAAARTGAKTRLVEVNGCLGGVWTAGLLSWILDSGNKSGIMRQMVGELKRRKASAVYGGSVGYDCERMKLMLEDLCAEAGVRVQLHTRVVAAAKDGSGRLALAVTESKSGRQAWAAKAFVDASGDGDLAAQAGCGFDYGRPGSGQLQPCSMIALLVGLDPDEVAPFVRGLAEPRGERNPKGRLLAEMERAGVKPSYSQPTLFYIRDGLFCMMANHEYGVSATDAAQISQATVRGRAEVHKLVDALRALGGPWKDVLVCQTAEHIGVREGRRIHGLYEVTAQDLAEGRKHEDAVCQVRFPVDIHSTDPEHSKGIERGGIRARPYDIPYRALVAKDVEGLLVAGRCISGDFVAHSSYRVTGDSVPLGEAAGAAAALAARSGRLPKDVPWPEIRKALDELASPEEPEAEEPAAAEAG